jgi:uridine phosphorylase
MEIDNMMQEQKSKLPKDVMSSERPTFNGKQLVTQLSKGDVARYVLLTVLWDYSSEAIAGFFDEAKKVADNGENVTFTGKYQGVPLTVTSVGVGSAAGVNVIDELVECGADTIIRVGCSGAIQPEIKIGDLVITSGAVRSENASRDYVSLEYPAFANHEVLMALIQSAENQGYQYHVGITRSADSFYLGQGRPGAKGYFQNNAADIVNYWRKTNVLNFEMEASSLLTLCNLFGCRGGAICYTLANRVENKLEFTDEGWKSTIKTAIESIRILNEWDRRKEAGQKKWLYPGLLTQN